MSDHNAPTATLAERVAGKWQIPAFLVSTILLVGVVTQVKAPDRKISVDEHLKYIRVMMERGRFDDAEKRAKRLLKWDDLDDAMRGTLNVYLARSNYGRLESEAGAPENTPELVVSLYELASRLGAELTARDERNMAHVFERVRQYDLAIKHYQAAAAIEGPPALADRRRIIEISDYPLHVPANQLNQMLDAFIADAENSPKQLLWALDRRIATLSGEEELREADLLLARYRDRFQGTDHSAEYQYLVALTLRQAQRYDEAERVVRELLNTVSVGDPVYPKAGWLLGRVVMFDGRAQRPEEAIAIFRDVIASRANPTYVAASRVALAEALATMDRFDEALDEYRDAVKDLSRLPNTRLVNPDVVRTSLSVVAERAMHEGELAVAVEYEKLALSLVPADNTDLMARHLVRLADVQVAYAHELEEIAADVSDETTPEQRSDAHARAGEMLVAAGDNQVQLAWLSTLNEKRSSEAVWTAATLYEEAGRNDRAIKILQRFVTERADAEMLPRVLLRLGKTLQAEGRYDEAVEAFQRNLSSFPRSPYATAALIPLAQSLMATGAKGEEAAEEALHQIVDDSPIFTPNAPEYRDALYLLADLYARQGRHEKAVAVADEILQRYPDDERNARARFLLAHGLYQSAMAIKKDLLSPEFAGESKRLDAERRERLDRSADVFHKLVERLSEKGESKLDALEALYLQDARLYEAACQYELGRYREALALYERAAWLYKESPAALGAYVQVINCDLTLGRREEAETALRRAQFLVNTIDEAQFKEAGQFESRDQWRKYFDWVSETMSQELVRK
ncbi:MAG: tetratricopeptide repeat protein [Phycisphaerales bacterium]|nr:tetratricopeptide repeat protein [Phycisphaerales bacterium]